MLPILVEVQKLQKLLIEKEAAFAAARNWVDAFLELPLSDEEKRKILWDNCARFYAMEVPASV